MQGSRCHAHTAGDAECAAPLVVPCQSCGFSNKPGEKFCSGCAAPLTAAGHPPELEFASPQAYTAKHLAERIMR